MGGDDFTSEISSAVNQYNDAAESQAAVGGKNVQPLWAVGAEVTKWSLIVLPNLQPFSFSKHGFKEKRE